MVGRSNLSDAPWRKSTYSGNANGCVEVAPIPGEVAIRDTKNRHQGHFTVTTKNWSAFISKVRRGF